MSDDATGSAGAVEAGPRPADPVSAAALASHARRMRPLRIGYVIAIVVALVGAAVTVKIAYDHGEISHASLRTVAKAPPSVALTPPSATQHAAWSSSDATAIGTPSFQGTVVTWDEHTVRGRNARTGRQTWSYTRTDRTVCTAMQDNGTTVAVYRLHGNCDELTAVNTGTGARLWTRTLDKDTAEFDGPATFAVQPGAFFFVSHTSVYAVAAGGLDNWTFHHPGCRINSAVLGSGGALISQTCRGQQCNGAKFCGNGTQLLLRDETAAYDDNSKTNKNNPDQIIWNRFGNDDVPMLAGQTIAARVPSTTRLATLKPDNGHVAATLPLQRPMSDAHAAAEVLDADLLWFGGYTYAFRADGTAFQWKAATVAVPTIPPSRVLPVLDESTPVVPTANGAEFLDPTTGSTVRRFTLGTIPAGSLVYRFGAGFVVAGSRTTVYD